MTRSDVEAEIHESCGMIRRLSFKAGTRAYKKRRRVAEAIARKHPGVSMSSKFRIATAAVNRGGLTGLASHRRSRG